MDKPQRVVVIHSPHSGRSTQLDQAVACLQQRGLEVADTIPIAALDALPPQGTNWQESGIDLAVAAGGDGLVGGVITHIVESDLPLGILPLGTANDIARSLAIPQNVEQAARVIADGHTQSIDVGMARPAEQAPHITSKDAHSPVAAHVSTLKHGFFAHALTLGLNVQFARVATNVATRQRYGRLTYPFAALEVLRNHAALDVQLQFEGLRLPPHRKGQHDPASVQEDLSTLSCRALQVAVINAPLFGGAWQLALPGSTLYDRLLDIVIIEELGLNNLGARLTHLFSGQEHNGQALESHNHERQFHHHPAELTGILGMHHLQAQGVVIQTNNDPRDVTLDGEVRGQTPMRVHMAEQRLQVLVPAHNS